VNGRDTTYLAHVAKAIRAIDDYLTDVTEDVFVRTPMIRDAVLRNLEIISEASRRLSDNLKDRYPGVPWTGIAGAGNVYRHDYDEVDDAVVWQTATAGLESLRELLRHEL
jgi:uncharacterized protein with HEPN domain